MKIFSVLAILATIAFGGGLLVLLAYGAGLLVNLVLQFSPFQATVLSLAGIFMILYMGLDKINLMALFPAI